MSWDEIKKTFSTDSALDTEMRKFCDERKIEDAAADAVARQHEKDGTAPDWRDVLAFAKRFFPESMDGPKWSSWPSDEMIIEIIKFSWWHGLGSHGVGGNWWSRVCRPAYEKANPK